MTSVTLLHRVQVRKWNLFPQKVSFILFPKCKCDGHDRRRCQGMDFRKKWAWKVARSLKVSKADDTIINCSTRRLNVFILSSPSFKIVISFLSQQIKSAVAVIFLLFSLVVSLVALSSGGSFELNSWLRMLMLESWF